VGHHRPPQRKDKVFRIGPQPNSIIYIEFDEIVGGIEISIHNWPLSFGEAHVSDFTSNN